MKILGVDTSSDLLGVAVIENKRILAAIKIRRKQGHSDYLIPLIEKVLKKAGIKLEDIDGFAVSKGPGSFTGLRIGITALRALSLVIKKPIIGVPTLDVIAHNANTRDNKSLVCPILDAKQNKVYACIFENKTGKIKRKSRYLLIAPEGLSGYIKNTGVRFIGDGIKIYGEKLKEMFGEKATFEKEKSWYPNAVVVARLGLSMLKNGQRDDPYNLVPMYLYPKECTVSNPKSLPDRQAGKYQNPK